jgi:hypothetical protein
VSASRTPHRPFDISLRPIYCSIGILREQASDSEVSGEVGDQSHGAMDEF